MTRIRIHPPAEPIVGAVTVSGSKSETNRALIAASLAAGRSRLLRCSPSDDTTALLSGLKTLGVRLSAEADTVEIEGDPKGPGELRGEIDLGLGGTSFRFLLAFASLAARGELVLTGSPRLCERPMGPLFRALLDLGADLESLALPDCAPVRLRGQRLRPGPAEVEIDGSVSSQFVSALLLIAPSLSGGLTLRIENSLVSAPYVDLTTQVMRAFGADLHRNTTSLRVEPTRYRGTEFQIGGDASAASYFWSIAALTGGRVRVGGLDLGRAQSDLGFADILARMGCEKRTGPDWIEIDGPSELKGIIVDMADMPDTAQTLAVVASQAQTPTEITGLSTLVDKETDRLFALNQELARLGITSEISSDSIRIQPGPLRGGLVETYHDHRMAMAFSLAGLRTKGVTIDAAEVVSKSQPDYWRQLAQLGVYTDAC